MKKNFLFGFAVLTIALVATFTMNVNTNDYGLSDISFANVEALAISENGSDCEGCLQWWPNVEYEGVICKSSGCIDEYKGGCMKWCN